MVQRINKTIMSMEKALTCDSRANNRGAVHVMGGVQGLSKATRVRVEDAKKLQRSNSGMNLRGDPRPRLLMLVPAPPDCPLSSLPSPSVSASFSAPWQHGR